MFFCRLIKHFNRFKRNWRSNTIFMLDNASYHKGQFIQRCFLELKICVMYLGPYQFNMAPVENFFSYVKSRNLNPFDTRCEKK